VHVILAMPEGAPTEPWIKAFSTALPQTRFSVWKDDGAAVDADAAIVWHPPAALFEREKRLRMVFNLGAGVDGLLAVPTLPPDLPVIRLEDAGMTLQMVEYVLHALWRATRQFDTYQRAQRDQEWAMLRVTRRQEWPVGVMGMGKIGQRVAQAIAPYEYPVAGWSRSPRQLESVESFSGEAGLPAFLKRTRVLINTLPLTPQTRDILNRETFAQLMPDAYIINVGRGEHLVEEDLLDALAKGQLAGATLDVFRTEPLPAGHPFWTHPAITVTPHISARTLRSESVAQIASKIRQLEKGETVTGVVDRSRGY